MNDNRNPQEDKDTKSHPVATGVGARLRAAYDPARELVPVSEVVRSDFILVVPNASPAKDVKGFLALAKAKADRVNFATFGAGTRNTSEPRYLQTKVASRSRRGHGVRHR